MATDFSLEKQIAFLKVLETINTSLKTLATNGGFGGGSSGSAGGSSSGGGVGEAADDVADNFTKLGKDLRSLNGAIRVAKREQIRMQATFDAEVAAGVASASATRFKAEADAKLLDLQNKKRAKRQEIIDKHAEKTRNAATAAATRASREAITATTNYTAAQASIIRSSQAMNETIDREWDAYNKLHTITNRTISVNAKLLNGLIEGAGLENEAHDKYITKLLASAKSLDSFSKTAYATANGLESARDLSEALEELTKESNFLKKAMDSTGEPINTAIERLLALKAAGGDLAKGEEDLLDIVRKRGLIEEVAGVTTVKSAAAFESHIKSVNRDMRALERNAEAQITMHRATEQLQEKFGIVGQIFGKKVAGFAAVMSLLSLFGAGLKGLWEQFKIVAGAGFANDFLKIKEAQLTLGVSIETLTKGLQENANIIAANKNTGVGTFTKLLDANIKGLNEFGLSNEQAAQAVFDFTKNAGKMGVDVRDQNKLDKAIKAQTKSFSVLHAISGTTIEEFNSMNDELINSQAVMQELNSTSGEERISKINEMMTLREQFTKLGVSAQTANKSLLAMKELGKETVANRITQASKLKAVMAANGMSAEKQQIAGDIVTSGNTKDPRLQLMINELMGRIDSTKKQGQETKDFGLESIADNQNRMLEETGGVIARMAENSREFNAAKAANKGLSDTEVAQRVADSKLDPTTKTMMNVEGILTQILNDPLAKLVESVAGIAAMMLTGQLTNLLSGLGTGIASVTTATGLVSAGIAALPVLLATALAAALAYGTAKIVGTAMDSHLDTKYGKSGHELLSKMNDDENEKAFDVPYWGGDTVDVKDWNEVNKKSTEDLQALIEAQVIKPEDLTRIQSILASRGVSTEPTIPEPAIPANSPSTKDYNIPSVTPAVATPKPVNSPELNTPGDAGKAGFPIVQLSDDTIARIVSKLDELYKQDTDTQKIGAQSRDFLELLVESNDAANKLAEDVAAGRRTSLVNNNIHSKLGFIQLN